MQCMHQTVACSWFITVFNEFLIYTTDIRNYYLFSLNNLTITVSLGLAWSLIKSTHLIMFIKCLSNMRCVHGACPPIFVSYILTHISYTSICSTSMGKKNWAQLDPNSGHPGASTSRPKYLNSNTK